MPELVVGLATQRDCVFCHLSDGLGEKGACGNLFQSIAMLVFLFLIEKIFLCILEETS